MTVVSSVMKLTDWLASLAFRAAKWRANNFGRWSYLTQLTLGIAPPSLQYFNRNSLILSILCRWMSDKVHIKKKKKKKKKKNQELNHPLLLYISTKL